MRSSAAAEGAAEGAGAVGGGDRRRFGDGCGVEALRVEDDVAAGTFAGGGGGQAALGEGEVERTALAGGHGGEGVGCAGGVDAGDGGVCLLLELQVACGLEVGGVEGHAVVLVGGEAEDLCISSRERCTHEF